MEQAARRLGLTRTVAAVVPGFAAAGAVLRHTELLLTVPRLAMADAAAAFALDERPPPFPLPPLSLSLFRSAVAGEEPGARWFLDRVREAAARLLGGSSAV